MELQKDEQYYGLGIVAKDKPTNSLYVEVTPIETMPNTDGEAGKKNIVNSSAEDSSGNANTAVVDKTTAITARWLNDNTSNIITPPLLS